MSTDTGPTATVSSPPLRIEIDDLSGGDVRALLDEHLEDMARHSPPESIHALSIDGLRHRDVRFWCVRQGDQLLGCGALKTLEPGHLEIKSMRTARVHRRRGIGALILDHLLTEARRRGCSRVSLETGSMAAFEPARQLYRSRGFVRCGPFADYQPDPNSVFMTLETLEGNPPMADPP